MVAAIWSGTFLLIFMKLLALDTKILLHVPDQKKIGGVEGGKSKFEKLRY